MIKPGNRFAGGVELTVDTYVLRLVVKQFGPHEFGWMADVRIRTPGVPLSDVLSEPNTESSAEAAQKAVRAAVSFFASCGVHLNSEQLLTLDRAVVFQRHCAPSS